MERKLQDGFYFSVSYPWTILGMRCIVNWTYRAPSVGELSGLFFLLVSISTISVLLFSEYWWCDKYLAIVFFISGHISITAQDHCNFDSSYFWLRTLLYTVIQMIEIEIHNIYYELSLHRKKQKLIRTAVYLETLVGSIKDRNVQVPGGFPVQTFADCTFDLITVICLCAIKCSSLNICTLDWKFTGFLPKPSLSIVYHHYFRQALVQIKICFCYVVFWCTCSVLALNKAKS